MHQQPPLTPQSALRVNQIIVFAMMSGLVIFLGVAHFTGRAEPSPVFEMFAYFAIALFAGAIAVRLFVPSLLATSFRRRVLTAERLAGERLPNETAKLLEGFTATTVFCAAAAEAPGFVAGLAYMFSRSPVGLAVAAATILYLATLVPTAARIEEWLANQTRLLDSDRQLT